MATNNKYYDYFGSFLPGNATPQPPGTGTTLYPANLLALLSDEGSVIPTQTAGKVRFDLNAILDAPGGLVSHDGAGVRFYDKAAVDAKIAALYAAIEGGGAVLPLPIFRAFWEADSGVTLVGGAVDAWADKTGNGHNLIAQDATLRPPYNATGWNGKPCLQYGGSHSLYIPALDLSDTQDVTLFVFGRRTSDNVMFLAEFTDNVSTSSGGFQLQHGGDAGIGNIMAGLQGDVATSVYAGAMSAGLQQANYYKSLSTKEVDVVSNGVAGTFTPYPNTETTDNTSAFTSAPFYLGSRANSSLFAEADVVAVGIVPRKTTPAENSQIAAYFNAKYP